ncbi:LOW QUALITY PROTEIN: S-acyl fatty acid synthase thioesterase, medium chain [Dromiciops gliroides]|uniref:LOW QUALITY PROTEIN: S-acyl fatty acid synthase thioesterase, medium chain n=1 Tax=Dromiciops gliroides TaxID=33562 RepID=UPI001CC5766F|nr:LOW QUALITY PROTEIN: S-acyl fatty acid synthase thioesterase, medium chain [Dromiciops gliroides]
MNVKDSWQEIQILILVLTVSYWDVVEVSSIRLPGRESRSKEPFATTMEFIVAEISNALLPILQDMPFAFFGHSMGSYVAFMTALHLKVQVTTSALFLSSANPPYKSPFFGSHISSISEEQMLHFVMNNDDTSKGPYIIKHIHTDYYNLTAASRFMEGAPNQDQGGVIVTECFVKPSKTPLSCDITCFSGTEDIVYEMEGWKNITSGSVESHKLPEGHFYLINPSNETFIINHITRCLEISYFA